MMLTMLFISQEMGGMLWTYCHGGELLRRTRTQSKGSADNIYFKTISTGKPWEQKTPPKREEQEQALTKLIEPGNTKRREANENLS